MEWDTTPTNLTQLTYQNQLASQAGAVLGKLLSPGVVQPGGELSLNNH